MDAVGVLDLLVGQRRTADAAEAGLLASVVHLVDLHPVLDPDTAAHDPGHDRPLQGVPTGTGGSSSRVPIAGVGCPEVTEDGVLALAAALGISYRAGLGLVGETLELRYRLPRLWALVQTGRLQAWKARRVARETSFLSIAAVGFVDRHLAVAGARGHLPTFLGPVLTLAINRCDPDQAEGREEAALEARHVTFAYSTSTDTGATADLTATLDLLDALDLDTQISTIATQLGRLGDPHSLHIRRSRALGMLAHPQHTLTLFGDPDTPHPNSDHADGGVPADGGNDPAGGGVPADGGAGAAGDPGSAAGSAGPAGVQGRSGTGVTVYVHVTAADLATHTPAGAGAGGGGGVRVEKLNGVTLGLLGDWLHRAHQVTIRPVLDPSRTDAVDAHDPPEWMRHATLLRDQQCVFPGCTIDARSCDLDHLIPYQPLDEGGPPGQTSLANLACLCRRHHRAKTRGTWAYQRLPDGDYRWTSPHQHLYTTRPGTPPGTPPDPP